LSETTISFCPICLERVEGRIAVKDGSAYLLKHCPQHGDQQALLEKNARYYLARTAFDKPGTATKTQTQTQNGCPFDCGLCPDHQQHTCIGLIEITNQCALGCPDCYARSSAVSPNCSGTPPPSAGRNREQQHQPQRREEHREDGRTEKLCAHRASVVNRDPGIADHQTSPSSAGTLSIEQVSRMMDFFQDAESGKAEVLQVSGGEPTDHPQVLEILKLAMTKGFKCVMLNTNGLRLAEEESFVRTLSQLGAGFEVYLQFDGFDREACKELRGADLIDTKRKAVEHLVRHRVPTTLVATIKQGVNDHEIGQVIEFGLNTDYIRGINFQPLAYFQGGDISVGEARTTVTDILERIEQQTCGKIRLDDFVPLPCDVERVAITYLYRSGGQFKPVTRNIDLRPCLPAIPNTFAFDADDFLKAAVHPGQPLAAAENACCGGDCAGSLLKLLRPLIPKRYGLSSDAQKIAHVTRNTFRVSVSSFVDPYNFDLKSMQKECVHVITPDLRRIPFSACNMFYRRT
jgi:7,8-dihydro-6-hydroxymethylpterin dimethyltransferase